MNKKRLIYFLGEGVIEDITLLGGAAADLDDHYIKVKPTKKNLEFIFEHKMHLTLQEILDDFGSDDLKTLAEVWPQEVDEEFNDVKRNFLAYLPAKTIFKLYKGDYGPNFILTDEELLELADYSSSMGELFEEDIEEGIIPIETMEELTKRDIQVEASEVIDYFLRRNSEDSLVKVFTALSGSGNLAALTSATETLKLWVKTQKLRPHLDLPLSAELTSRAVVLSEHEDNLFILKNASTEIAQGFLEGLLKSPRLAAGVLRKGDEERLRLGLKNVKDRSIDLQLLDVLAERDLIKSIENPKAFISNGLEIYALKDIYESGLLSDEMFAHASYDSVLSLDDFSGEDAQENSLLPFSETKIKEVLYYNLPFLSQEIVLNLLSQMKTTPLGVEHSSLREDWEEIATLLKERTGERRVIDLMMADRRDALSTAGLKSVSLDTVEEFLDKAHSTDYELVAALFKHFEPTTMATSKAAGRKLMFEDFDFARLLAEMDPAERKVWANQWVPARAQTWNLAVNFQRGAAKKGLGYLVASTWDEWDNISDLALNIGVQWLVSEMEDLPDERKAFIRTLLPAWEGTLEDLLKASKAI